MSVQFATRVPVPSTVTPAQGADVPDGCGDDLAARLAAGPGLWEDWLGELRRSGLIEELLQDGTIARAAAQADHGHKLDRALTAEVTAMCVLAGALFPEQGYDLILARVFGMPGVPVKPGTAVPSGPALSKARMLLGEAVMRRAFDIDAARDDIGPGEDGTVFGMEATAFDGTTLEVFANEELAAEFGVPEGGTKPKIRIVALVQTGTRRWKAAEVGGYTDGENALVDQMETSLGEGMVNFADRGFFSMDRWKRFSATGAHLIWRVKNGKKSVPFKVTETLSDGSELVRLHESNAMLGKRRRGAGDKKLARHPDMTARLVTFTVLTRTARGRVKSTQIRVLTTLLDPDVCPSSEIAASYARRWQIEIAFLHLKKTLRGTGRTLRGRSVTLVRQEAWALLLVHNMIAALASRAIAAAGRNPGTVSYLAVLSLVRSHVDSDACCRHCGRRPTAASDPLAQLIAAILAQPAGRTGRKRTSGRTPAERRSWHTEPVDYTITIVPSNLPNVATSPAS